MIDTSHHFTFELVAPEKVEVSGLEERVQLPGAEGDFTVLAGHQQLLAALRPGIVTVFRAHDTVRYFINGGMADVGNEHCIVLAPHIIPVTALEIDALKEDIFAAEERLEAAIAKGDAYAREMVQDELDVLLVKLSAAEEAAEARTHSTKAVA